MPVLQSRKQQEGWWKSMTELCIALLCLGVAAAFAAEGMDQPRPGRPPETRRQEVRETIHGATIVDPYRWLEDQDSPETRAWIAAQNAYTKSVLGGLPSREKLAQRLEELLRVERVGLPTVRNGRYFYSRKRPSDEQAVLYWRRGIRGKERVLFDPHPLSPDKTVSASLMDVSKDGRWAAIGIRRGGEDEVEVRIRNVDTGQDAPDSLPRAHIEDFSFTAAAHGFYYTKLTPLQGRRVHYHRMGTDTAKDPVIFGEGYDAQTMVGQGISENGRWLVLLVYRGWTQNDIFVQDLQNGGPIRPVVVGVDATFMPEFAGDRLLTLTDYKAPRRRVLEADLTGAAPPDRWREVVPEGSSAIEEFSATAGRLFVSRLENVSTRLEMYDLDGKKLGDVRLPGIGTATVPSGLWEGNEAFYNYQSFTTPPENRRIVFPSGRQTVWSKVKVPFRRRDIVTEQIWYTSRDGTRIPMFLVRRRSVKPNGKLPVHLTGYGGFGLSITPSFDPEALIWVESGGVLAVPSLRGGGEFGEEWHRAGMRDKKQNVFDDFEAAARWLIAQGYTTPERLAISGGSNGGLLVGAAMTQHPDLYRAVVCEVPLLDMLRYHLFLQGPQWVPEYGSADNPQEFRVLHSYSPYHRVKPGTSYPAVLFVTGDSDTRVAPLHARKMTALLQSVQKNGRPVLLYYETEVGHSGGEPVSRQVERRSHVLAFLFHELGLEPAALRRAQGMAPSTSSGAEQAGAADAGAQPTGA